MNDQPARQLLNLTLSLERRSALPGLAFAATLSQGSRTVSVVCGPAVEVDERGVIAGAWAGPFQDRAIERATTAIGTGFRLTPDAAIAFVGTASASALYFSRVGSQLVFANTLALALAVANDDLVASYPFYTNDMTTFVLGDSHYRHTARTERGTLSAYYGPMIIDDDLRLRPAPAIEPPRFADFAGYRAYLLDQTRQVFANAADPARQVRYRPTAVISAGYDSPAAGVIARDAGCTEAITFGQAHDQHKGNEDSGAEIGERLGLKVAEHRTHAYRERGGSPEIEFIASSFGGGQMYLASSDGALDARVVVSGYGGDHIWARDFGKPPPRRYPMSIGGYSQNEFYIRAPALDFSIPTIGSRNFADIGAISRSDAMAPWSVGGDYDRPIARRLLEEAGVARGTFATRKRRITPDYDNFARRSVVLSDILTPASLAAFEAWFAKVQPLPRGRAFRHGLLLNTFGRVLWSNKLRRFLTVRGIDWPPFASRLLRLKVPVRRNSFVFTWAVGEQIQRYRKALA
jgi:hypothetical protein